jgi:hypothetical protein
MQLLHLQLPHNHHLSVSPSPLANKSLGHASPQNLIPAWDMCKAMFLWLAGGEGLEQVIVAAADAIPEAGLPDPSEWAGGEGRFKRKAGEITRSAAEDFAPLTIHAASIRYAADFFSTVDNVSFYNDYLKISNYF